MLKKIIHFLIFVCIIFTIGCGDNSYYDEHMQMEVLQLDSDLKNRWSTSGVVINSITTGGPADKADLSQGELISYIIGEYPIQRTSDFKKL